MSNDTAIQGSSFTLKSMYDTYSQKPDLGAVLRHFIGRLNDPREKIMEVIRLVNKEIAAREAKHSEKQIEIQKLVAKIQKKIEVLEAVLKDRDAPVSIKEGKRNLANLYRQFAQIMLRAHNDSDSLFVKSETIENAANKILDQIDKLITQIAHLDEIQKLKGQMASTQSLGF